MPMETMARMAVESEAVSTIRNLPKHQMRAGDRAAEDGFDGAALFFARGQIHGRVHGAGQSTTG